MWKEHLTPKHILENENLSTVFKVVRTMMKWHEKQICETHGSQPHVLLIL